MKFNVTVILTSGTRTTWEIEALNVTSANSAAQRKAGFKSLVSSQPADVDLDEPITEIQD